MCTDYNNSKPINSYYDNHRFQAVMIILNLFLFYIKTIDEDILDAMVIIVYHLMHRDYLKVILS